MRVGLVQLNASDDPDANLPVTRDMVARAAAEGAQLVTTPEVTSCVSADRAHQQRVARPENDDRTLAALRDDAARLGLWLHIGSLGVQMGDADGRLANRGFLIGPDGAIAARYDKIHMFDVQVSETETYRESGTYRPGARAVTVDTPLAKIGLTICYDLRFPSLHRALAQAGAQVLLSPAAFSPGTGPAHWQPLLQARAIETGCFVLAAAQTGRHQASVGRARSSHGHSLAVDPWGQVLLDAGTEPGVSMVTLDLDRVAQARGKVPSLSHDRAFDGP
ncbi:carbon-nitrogen hydrolase family protein [Maribius pontilimi]|uniref:Carbon-nitrogen hydrolase family protein n=1 Tax=Palleronia pontilimi TaxID=1964209 RepID=A0A934MBJ8_9RHOB|nr:carbon-nitrogen hydrolase family protein [Palleronia pontilimi]MBJ3761580.1 carbon-nitrogen hydrolase family protein [Palleronia pontilimi]